MRASTSYYPFCQILDLGRGNADGDVNVKSGLPWRLLIQVTFVLTKWKFQYLVTSHISTSWNESLMAPPTFVHRLVLGDSTERLVDPLLFNKCHTNWGAIVFSGDRWPLHV